MGLAAVVIAVCAAGVLGGCSLEQGKRERRRAADVPVTVKLAAPIITAIEKYAQASGAPPTRLDALVPKYLIRLPDAGLVARDGWHFEPSSPWGGWTLFVLVRDDYSPNLFLGFGDTFAYHSSGQYPDHAYGGVLKRFGSWGYYVE